MNYVYSILKRFPYAIAIIAGLLFYLLASLTSDNLSGLLLNISASLVTIPIVIFSYEAIKEKVAKEDNRDLSEYVKMNIDREILSLLNRVSPLVIGTPTPGLNKVLKLLNMNEEKMRKTLENYSPMAYYLATDWGYSEDQFALLLANELIYNNLSVDERNAFIRLIKAVRTLEYATSPRFYKKGGDANPKYTIVKGSEIDQVTKFQNRYLLMAKTKKSNELAVAAFNDLKMGKYKIDLLTPMKPNNDGKELLLSCTLEILECISAWSQSRGKDFLIDSRNFRMKRTRLKNRLEQ
ncbi:MAG TPA: hypothetical protein VF733_05170 [Candidatus Saccharimonadales bacterium]